MEALKARDDEVLFCYETYDELVLMNLAQFDKKNLKSIENEVFDDIKTPDQPDKVEEASGKGQHNQS